MAGWLLFRFGSYHYIGAVTKALAVVVGTAWVGLMAFATKISDITESPALTPEEHRRLEHRSRLAVRRIWALSGANALAVLFLLGPSAAVDSKSTVYEWMIIVSGMAVAFAAYSIALQAWWQEELRSFRSDLRLREREERRQAEIRAQFEKASQTDTRVVDEEISRHNRSFDWPEEPPPKHH